jgi:DNA repair exonuclease SbcCD ATPase subunit
MKNLKIKQLKAYNFLAFGEDGVEIDLENLGNVVLIKGKNLDYIKDIKNDELKNKDSSNGSGKSSIQEIISYALYGKTIKSPKKISKDDVINNLLKKGCRVEIIIEDYKISRGRNPDFLRLWKSSDGKWTKENEITQGKTQDTQEKIESIIGINYDVFISTCVFSDDQSSSFLEADLSNKRSIIENLLSLDVYRNRFDHSKNLLKDKKASLKQLNSEYEILDNNKSSLDKRLLSTKESENSWKNLKKNEIAKIISVVKLKKARLESLNEDKDQKDYDEARKRITEIDKLIDTTNKQIDSYQESLKSSNEKKSSLKLSLDKKNDEIKEIKRSISDNNKIIEQNSKEINNFKNKDKNKKCEHCLSKINPDNFLEIIKKHEQQNESTEEEIKNLNIKLNKINLSKLEDDFEKLDKEVKKLEKSIADKNSTYKSLRDEHKKLSLVKEPNTNTEKSVIEKEIEVLKAQAKELNSELQGSSPYESVIKDIEKDITDSIESIDKKKNSVKEIEKDIPYLDFWVEAFGDSGIRKWVVDGIIPILNKKLQYLMMVLDNNRLKIEFDNELKESIYKNIDGEDVKFKYHTLSAGQRRRLNLAVNQSFAHVMIDSVGSCPNLVFLDEVTTNIDPIGVLGIYSLICELAEDRQVFVTTHDQDLLEMLNGCDVLNLEMKNGISKLEVKQNVSKK